MFYACHDKKPDFKENSGTPQNEIFFIDELKLLPAETQQIFYPTHIHTTPPRLSSKVLEQPVYHIRIEKLYGIYPT